MGQVVGQVVAATADPLVAPPGRVPDEALGEDVRRRRRRSRPRRRARTGRGRRPRRPAAATGRARPGPVGRRRRRRARRTRRGRRRSRACGPGAAAGAAGRRCRPPASPATTAPRTPGRLPSAMTTSTPDQVAILAAASFDAMPPLPTSLPGPPATASSRWSISTTSSMSEASSACRGSAVSRPGVSVSRTSRSAPTRWATRALSRSLSPKRISSSATASFSLTTGTTPSSSRWASVPRACRYCWRWTKSSGASSTWPASRSCGARPSCQARISRCWPTAETAWRTAGSVGRGPWRPRADHPAAMAPDVTTTTSRPCRCWSAISAPSRPTTSRSVSPSDVVTVDEPTLTTRIGRLIDGPGDGRPPGGRRRARRRRGPRRPGTR